MYIHLHGKFPVTIRFFADETRLVEALSHHEIAFDRMRL